MEPAKQGLHRHSLSQPLVILADDAVAQSPTESLPTQQLFCRTPFLAPDDVAKIPIASDVSLTSPSSISSSNARTHHKALSFDRSSYTPAFSRLSLSTPREQVLGLHSGIVDNVKKSYGFVKDRESDHRFFFHFSEVASQEVNIGDKVEFYVDVDKDKERPKAIDVRVVHALAVPKEEAKRSHQRSKTLSAIKHLIGKNDELVEMVSKKDFLLTDGEMNVGLPNADGVREEGVVVSHRQRYGFLKCTQRAHKQVFFHFAELMDPSEGSRIRQGIHLEFVLSKNLKGKPVATQICIAKRDAPEITGKRMRGTVITVPLSHGDDPKEGRIQNKSDPEDFISFSKYSIEKLRIVKGDVVDVIRTKEKADQVILVQPSSLGRRRGLIGMTKDMYGFIRCEQRRPMLFYHVKEKVVPSQMLSRGLAVEFDIGKDEHGRQSARRVLLCDPCLINKSQIYSRGVVVEDGKQLSKLGLEMPARQCVLYSIETEDLLCPIHLPAFRHGDVIDFLLDNESPRDVHFVPRKATVQPHGTLLASASTYRCISVPEEVFVYDQVKHHFRVGEQVVIENVEGGKQRRALFNQT